MSTIFRLFKSCSTAATISRSRAGTRLITFMRPHDSARGTAFRSRLPSESNTRLTSTLCFFHWCDGVYNRCCGSIKLQEEGPCRPFDLFFYNSNPTSEDGYDLFLLDSDTLEPGQITLFVCSHVASDTVGFLLRPFRSNYKFDEKWSREPAGDLCVYERNPGGVGESSEQEVLGKRWCFHRNWRRGC